MNNNDVLRRELESRWQQLHQEFEQQMRARGFDPAQAENVALPTELARLYGECLVLRQQLEEIQKDDQ